VAKNFHVPEPVVPKSESELAEIAKRDFDGSETAPPKLIYSVRPVYPSELHRANIDGKVMVELTVDAEGRPQAVHSSSATQPLFALAAEAAVRQWRFTPRRKDGKPVAARIVIPLEFSHDANAGEKDEPAKTQ
jgi:TonB family protein